MSGFFDARKGEVPSDITASICIVGAGAAGLTLARALAPHVPDLVLVESGGLDIDGRTQNLYAGRNLGLDYHNLTSNRLRYFGGTTNHWSGYCRANDPIDYEGRADLGLPAWPMGHAELAPYIDTAAAELGITGAGFDPVSLLEAQGLDPAQLVEERSEVLSTKVFQLAEHIRLGPIHRAELEAADNLRTLLNLNVTHVQLAEDGQSVAHLDCATLDGTQHRIRAKAYVLCCHAIENARLLLTSNDVQSTGIGNGSDHVGRYFMDHIYITASEFIPTPDFPAVYNWSYARDHALNANLSFSDDMLRREGLLQYYCRFAPRYMSEAANDALRDVRQGYDQPGDLEFLGDLMTVLGSARGVVKRELMDRDIRYSNPDRYVLEHRLEQAPNPDSRVVISDRRDALGNLIADLDFRISAHDVDTFRRGQALVGQEMAALGYGRLIEEDITRELVEDRVSGHYHHIGTTRMSDSAATGVVDGHHKVHDVGNLYIGGSSVFPTAGYSGPTMMIMAMSLRLADHLKEVV